MRSCVACQSQFSVTAQEDALRAKVSADIVRLLGGDDAYAFSQPRLCPECRQQRRLAMRNERKLYQRSCGLCSKRFISVYSPDKPDTVYCTGCWWGDGWDPLAYGKPYDPKRAFLDQWHELYRAVPKLGLVILGENQNSDFTNDNYRLKNCYLVYDGEQAVDCMFGETFSHLKDCLDFHTLQHSELCYECINCSNCYDLRFSRFCQNCVSSAFLIDCIGCKNCFGCANLHQKEFHIFNQPHSKDDYFRKLEELKLDTHSGVESIRSRCESFFAEQPKRALRGVRNENVSGDNLISCKDCFDCFDCRDSRDCGFCTNLLIGGQDCLDVNVWGDDLVLAYNSACVGLSTQSIAACYYVYSSCSSVYYSAFCSRNCRYLFGCIGLKHKEHYILNTAYSPDEYVRTVKKIAAELIECGAWGEFFPPSFSAFGYNETVAQEYFPLSRREAEARGFKWSDYESPRPEGRTLEAAALPDSIAEVTDEIASFAIECEISKRLYRITKSELEFYRRQRIPLPRRHPDQRHLDRLLLRNPRYLWTRSCGGCGTELRSSYSLQRPEQVLCENCYRDRFLS
jgi:hypothetical protein